MTDAVAAMVEGLVKTRVAEELAIERQAMASSLEKEHAEKMEILEEAYAQRQQQIEREQTQKIQDLEGREARLVEREAKLLALGASGNGSSSGKTLSDVMSSISRVRLNVGGTVFETTITTLRAHTFEPSDHGYDNVLAMSALKGNVQQSADDNASVLHAFIDCDPALFAIILRYLRTGYVLQRHETQLSATEWKELAHFARYFELNQLWSKLTGDDRAPSGQGDGRQLRNMVSQQMLIEVLFAPEIENRPLYMPNHMLDNLTFFGKELTNAVLSGSSLRFACLAGCNLSYANLKGCNLSGADLSNCNLSHANLERCNLSGADLFCCSLDYACLQGCNLSRVDLRNCSLSSALLEGIDLAGTNLSGRDFSNTTLKGSHLAGADLSNCNLTKANLEGSNLSGADLRKCTLNDTILSGCDLCGADFRDATLTSASFRGASSSRETQFTAAIKAAFDEQVGTI